MASENMYLYGKHALEEALVARPQVVKKVFLSVQAQQDASLMQLLSTCKISPQTLKQDTKQLVSSDAVHQGVIALVQQDALYTPLDAVWDMLATKERKAVVIFDELQDPHNVGAIIRSAAAFGVGAVFLTKHNQAPVTASVIKTSAGMVFRIPIVLVPNTNQLIRELKDRGYWVYGLMMHGDTKLPDATFDTPVAFVVGNESEGIRQKTRELCDIALSIPMSPSCESLNAATATTVVLYEWSRHHL